MIDLKELNYERDRILRPIREQVGYPVSGDTDGDDWREGTLDEYIQALESALVGTMLAAKLLGKHVNFREDF